MVENDDDLTDFAAHGASLPNGADWNGFVGHEGAQIWAARYGMGRPVVLLHGGLGHGGNWAKQVPALVAAGYQAIVIDSRGHGRSTRDERPFSYELMAGDVLAVLDHLGVARAAIVGWSDGACTGLALVRMAPERVSGVVFFACNVDNSGAKNLDFDNPLLGRCIGRHRADYAALSATPDAFDAFMAAVGEMQSDQPNYGLAELAQIVVPVLVLLGEHDEFIRAEHMDYLATELPDAERVTLPGVSHFAPLQRPALFNGVVEGFLARLN
jgi:pimeloyl-ACP methyl ester carboxylesterase